MEPNLKPAGAVYKHILLGKLSLAVVSSIVFQSVVLLLYLFALGFSLVNPVSSTGKFFGMLVQPSTWLYLLPFLGIVFAQGVICAKDYVIGGDYSSTRFHMLISVFSIRNILLLILHVVTGFSTVWLYLALGDADKLEVFNENVFYLLLGGGWTGLYYFLHAADKRVLFPVAHQGKWLRFKGGLAGILRESRNAALFPALHLAVAYFIFGASLSEFFDFQESEGGVNGLLVYALSWFYSTLIYFHMNMMVFFYELFLTEPLEFPIASESASLKDAIRSDVPIIRQLACLDFFLLTGNSRRRREALFSLSQPGGHPHNWNDLIENVLRTITEYADTLNRSTDRLLAPEKPKEAVVAEQARPNVNYDKLRPMVAGLTVVPVKPLLREKFDSILTTVKQRSGYNYVFCELPEAGIQKSLADGQTIVWITQALASVTTTSIKEDRYGIVQKDLPVILSTLVELKSSVDKLNRIPALNRKGTDDFNVRMKAGVASAVKRSLFQLCSGFGPYLKDLNLKKTVLAQLQAFAPAKFEYC